MCYELISKVLDTTKDILQDVRLRYILASYLRSEMDIDFLWDKLALKANLILEQVINNSIIRCKAKVLFSLYLKHKNF